jgi:putative restriction endonuclease
MESGRQTEQHESRAWRLLAFGAERNYAANLGYDDELERIYRYDSFVQNHRQVKADDLVMLWSRSGLEGVGRVARVGRWPGTKQQLRCPSCGTSRISSRKHQTPRWRCQEKHEFELPDQVEVTCTLYEADFGDSFIACAGGLSEYELQSLFLVRSNQLSIRPLDLGVFKALLTQRLPEVAVQLFGSPPVPTDRGVTTNDRVPTILFALTDDYDPDSDDQRRRAQRELAVRQGQPQFRKALQLAYGPRCMISRCELMGLVDAAHISPHRGTKDNHPGNGLLLRTDLHTLFDLDLLGIDPESMTVRMSSSAAAAGYSYLDGAQLVTPEGIRPSVRALEARWRRFLLRTSRLSDLATSSELSDYPTRPDKLLVDSVSLEV